jgi:hypothetical protein
MAGALYRVDYVGQTAGAAVIYVGGDGITGMDAQGGIFSGGISVSGDRARGTVVIRYSAGATLVTGQTVPPNGQVTIQFDERADYLNGVPVAFPIDGRQVSVVFTKIQDIPIPPSLDGTNPANAGQFTAAGLP